jgi:hypothetical protein
MEAMAWGVRNLPKLTLDEKAESHEGEIHAEPAAAAPVTADAAMAELETGLGTIETLARSGHDGLHEAIEHVMQGPLVALKAAPALAPQERTRLDGALRQFGQQLGKVHAAADAKDASALTAALLKARAALKLVTTVLQPRRP